MTMGTIIIFIVAVVVVIIIIIIIIVIIIIMIKRHGFLIVYSHSIFLLNYTLYESYFESNLEPF